MKIACISDIHGNAAALEAVLDNIAAKTVDKILVLGDICYRGPEPKRALDLVRSLKTNVIKGNADAWVQRGIHQGEVPDSALEMMRIERDWTVSKLSDEDIDYLGKLPESMQMDMGPWKIACFHATPVSLFDIVSPTEEVDSLHEKIVKHMDANIYVYGHIHTPYIRFFHGKSVVNIGSVGLPFDGLNKSSYAIIEGDENDYEITIQRVTYDYEQVIKQYHEFEYPNNHMMEQIIKTGLIKR